ncbi:MAG: T9SS type A sorting domain-containing protein [Saprospiraceae bacterium]
MKSLLSIFAATLFFANLATAQYYEEYFNNAATPRTEQFYDGQFSTANPTTNNLPTVVATGFYQGNVTGAASRDRVRVTNTDLGGTPLFNNAYQVTINNVEVNSYGYSQAEVKGMYVVVGTLRDANLTIGGADVLIMQVKPGSGVLLANPIKVDMDKLSDVAYAVIASATPNIFYICGENLNTAGIATSFIMKYDAAANAVQWVRRFDFSTATATAPSSLYGLCETSNGSVVACGKLTPTAGNTDGLIIKTDALGGALVYKSYNKYTYEEFRSIRNSVGKGPFTISGNCKTSSNDPNSVLLLWMNTTWGIFGYTLSTAYDTDYCYDAIERKNTAGQFEYFTAGKTKTTGLAANFQGSVFKFNASTTTLTNYLYGETRDDNFYAIDALNTGSASSDGISMFGQFFRNVNNSWITKAYFNGLTAPNCIVKSPTTLKVAIDFPIKTWQIAPKINFSSIKVSATPVAHQHWFLCTGNNVLGSNALINDNDDNKSVSLVEGISLYPNPMGGSNELNISFEHQQEGNVNIELYDSNGRLMQRNLIIAYNGDNQTTFDMSAYPQGAYYIRLISKEINMGRKIIR